MISAGAAMALTFAGGAALAAQDEDGRKVDRDITRAEVAAAASTGFARMDADSDGYITDTDRAAIRKRRMEERFAKADADSDGRVSRAEFKAALEAAAANRKRPARRGKRGGDPAQFAERIFGFVDGNGDGYLTRAEMETAAANMPRDGRGRGRMAALGKRADTDNDGRISEAEFVASSVAMFDRADADGDGTVTVAERRQLRAERKDRKTKRSE
ncbi:MAG: EF-hand domain-containing protein [Sphingomonadaceae bacterium]